MKILISKITNIIFLMASVAWLATEKSWEPLIAVLTFFFAGIGLEITSYQLNKKEKGSRRVLSKFDEDLFRRFVELIPPTGNPILFLKEHDVGGTFRESDIQALWDYVDTWKGPTISFFNKDLEKVRKEFDQQVRDYVYSLGNHTFSHHRDGFLTMDMESMSYDSEKEKARNELNKTGTELAEKYEELYRLGTSLLNENQL